MLERDRNKDDIQETAPLIIFVTVYAISSKIITHCGKLDKFLIGNIPRNLITAMDFPQLKWLLIYGSKMANIDFYPFLL